MVTSSLCSSCGLLGSFGLLSPVGTKKVGPGLSAKPILSKARHNYASSAQRSNYVEPRMTSPAGESRFKLCCDCASIMLRSYYYVASNPGPTELDVSSSVRTGRHAPTHLPNFFLGTNGAHVVCCSKVCEQTKTTNNTVTASLCGWKPKTCNTGSGYKAGVRISKQQCSDNPVRVSRTKSFSLQPAMWRQEGRCTAKLKALVQNKKEIHPLAHSRLWMTLKTGRPMLLLSACVKLPALASSRKLCRHSSGSVYIMAVICLVQLRLKAKFLPANVDSVCTMTSL